MWNGRQRVTAVLLLLFTATMGYSAGAQTPAEPVVDFVVSPSRLEIRASPGDRLDASVEVFNRGPDPLSLETYVEDITIPATDLIDQEDLAFTASRWISFGASNLEVEAGDSIEARLHVVVPADTPTGGYHAFAFIQSEPLDVASAVVPSGRIGVTLLLEVAPAGESLQRSAKIAFSDMDLQWPSWLRPVVTNRTIVENIGETHVTIGGADTYRTWPGQSGSTVKLGPYVALRGTLHTFESETAAPIFGKVTVTTEVVYQVSPEDLPVIVVQNEVWIIPWHLVATASSLSGGVWWWRRRMKNKTEETS
jgi:hypothetical protein